MSGFTEDPVNEVIYGKRGIMTAIDILFSNQCVLQGVMMILIGTDVMANVDRPAAGRDDKTQENFKDWVAKYVRIPGDQFLTPDDLWGARNALLHTYGIYSKHVHSGKARIIIWLQNPHIAVWPDEDNKSVRVDPFVFRKAFSKAVSDFLCDALSNPDRKPLVESRLKDLVTYTQFIDESLSSAHSHPDG